MGVCVWVIGAIVGCPYGIEGKFEGWNIFDWSIPISFGTVGCLTFCWTIGGSFHAVAGLTSWYDTVGWDDEWWLFDLLVQINLIEVVVVVN